MADIEIEVVTGIEGLDELERDFLEGSKRAVKKFLRHVEREAAQVLVDSAKDTAPYDTVTWSIAYISRLCKATALLPSGLGRTAMASTG